MNPQSQNENPLARWRHEIDALDTQLLEVLARRVQVVLEIGKYKKIHGLAPLDPQRWQQVLNGNIEKGKALNLSQPVIEALYHLIHDYSLELEHNMDISYLMPTLRVLDDLTKGIQLEGAVGIQGGRGSFNEQALTQFLTHKRHLDDCSIRYLYTSENVAKALVNNEIALGQCAISNSIGGEVQETLDILEQYPLKVVGKFEIKIAHALMIRPDQDWQGITTIMCHPQVFAQCQRNLVEKYSHLKQVSGQGDLLDSARVAEALSRRELPNTVAVMGSRMFADLYGLQVIEDNLQDLSNNYTRFILLAKQP